MRLVRFVGSCGLTLTLVTVSCGKDSGGKSVPDGGGKSDADVTGNGGTSGGGASSAGGGGGGNPGTGGTSRGGAGPKDASAGTGGGSSADSGTIPDDAGPELSSDGAIVVPANDHCTSPKTVALSAATPHVDIRASTFGATHDVDAPCNADSGPDVFYELVFSRRVFLYADTFGAKWNTVLFLTSKTCVPIAASTTSGDAICNDDACGTSQSRLVALLEPGYYRLGLGGHGAAAEGAATIHLEWTLAGNGAVKGLPAGDSVQTGTTAGSGNIDGKSAACVAAAAEDSYWWANCPGDAGGSLTASTCNGATWETVLETEIPQSAPYTCSLDACGLQSSLTQAIPGGPGLRVLSIDGQGGGDLGAYTLTVTRP